MAFVTLRDINKGNCRIGDVVVDGSSILVISAVTDLGVELQPYSDIPDCVNVGAVAPFPNAEQSKAQAIKPLEEAGEIVDSWKKLNAYIKEHENEEGFSLEYSEAYGLLVEMLNECADCITAICNLCAAYGETDLAPYIMSVEVKNRERGRYDEC